jgi:hypothetical protein
MPATYTPVWTERRFGPNDPLAVSAAWSCFFRIGGRLLLWPRTVRRCRVYIDDTVTAAHIPMHSLAHLFGDPIRLFDRESSLLLVALVEAHASVDLPCQDPPQPRHELRKTSPFHPYRMSSALVKRAHSFIVG